jgi:hypothetical protein
MLEGVEGVARGRGVGARGGEGGARGRGGGAPASLDTVVRWGEPAAKLGLCLWMESRREEFIAKKQHAELH